MINKLTNEQDDFLHDIQWIFIMLKYILYDFVNLNFLENWERYNIPYNMKKKKNIEMKKDTKKDMEMRITIINKIFQDLLTFSTSYIRNCLQMFNYKKAGDIAEKAYNEGRQIIIGLCNPGISIWVLYIFGTVLIFVT